MATKPKSKELCRRVRLMDSSVTFHVVSDEGKLTEVSENTYRQYEFMATRTDTLYSKSDRKFTRSYKTVYFA